MENPQAGWYPDPSGDVTKLRYWDGIQWTENYTDTQQVTNANNGYYASPYAQPAYGQDYYPAVQSTPGTDRTFALIAFIFCLLSTVSVGWLLIPLAWMIPMTVHCWGIYKGEKPNTVCFGVCTLIFLSIVGGICLLIGKKDA